MKISYITMMISFALLMASAAQAQTVDPLTVGVVKATGGAVQTLEDAMTQRLSQIDAGIQANDYKQWNAEFRVKLNAAMLKYESQVESQIAAPLKPFAERYEFLLRTTHFNPRQLLALKKAELSAMQAKADLLTRAYGNIYIGMLRDLLPWLPIIRGVEDADSCSDLPFIFASLDGRYVIFKDKVYVHYSDCSEVIKKSEAREFVASQWSLRGDYDVIKKVFDKALVPYLTSVCRSQVCLPLVESDLELALNTIVKNIHRPFQVVFQDGGTVKINAADYNVPGDLTDYGLLEKPVVDLNLPFDDRGELGRRSVPKASPIVQQQQEYTWGRRRQDRP